MLDDSSHIVRAAAADALGAIKDRTANQPLIDLQDREEYVYV
jgi:HEAT repeat protein